MPTTSLADLQQVANMNLKAAILNERSKRWKQVVQNYRRLLRSLDPENFPVEMNIPPWFAVFLFEVYYHLGIALQHVHEQQKAAVQFTRAIDVISTSKNGCTAGCTSSTCLLTPVYTRRALAHGCSGHLVAAKQDAEKAVILDSKNPDVYCVRALVYSSKGDEQQALQDVQKALKFNTYHPSALILKGNFTAPLSFSEMGIKSKPLLNKDHRMACDINPDCHNYLSVQDFKHHQILDFYDRLLFSLGVPHTVSQVPSLESLIEGQGFSHLTSPQGQHPHTNRNDSRMSKQTNNTSSVGFVDGTMSRALRQLRQRHQSEPVPRNMSFKCGTPVAPALSRDIVRRRVQYGEAIRDYTTPPQTGDEYIAMLRKQKSVLPPNSSRPPSAPTSASHYRRTATTHNTHHKPQSLPGRLGEGQQQRRTRDQGEGRVTSAKHSRTSSAHSIAGHAERRGREREQPASSGGHSRSSSVNRTSETSRHTMQVFQPVNVKDAPRMYYKPWAGDRLPIGEKYQPQHKVIPFVV